jgi:hypothetical protein
MLTHTRSTAIIDRDKLLVSNNEARAGELMLPTMWDHTIRGRSWDGVSARTGLLLTTDTIYFNGRGAEIIADLIEGWLCGRAASLT